MKKLVLVFVLLVVACPECLAWGPKGHAIVAELARERLSEASRRNIIALLGNDDLSAIASWADEIRSNRPETYGWHFVDIPRNASGFSQARDCFQPDDKRPASLTDHHNCIVDRIKMFKAILKDKKASPADRIEALKFLVHFVGDIHQPLHAILEARGGNDIHVVAFGSPQCGTRPCNLHSQWDAGLIEHTQRSQPDYVTYLNEVIQERKLRSGGKPKDWANKSLKLARQVWLNEGDQLDENYFRVNIQVVDEQLALAGLRLAKLLNDVFHK